MRCAAPWGAALLALAVLAACASRAAPHTIVGRYRMHVGARDNPPWRGIVGDWEAEYRADGHLQVRHDGFQLESRYRLDGEILTISDLGGGLSCRQIGIDSGSARYRVRYLESGFRVEPLQDECASRAFVRSNQAWRRIQ